MGNLCAQGHSQSTGAADMSSGKKKTEINI